MFAADPLLPVLPPGTLCLTFDDGPGVTIGDARGPKTDRLADFLADEGVRATFFMCGKYVRRLPGVVRRVHDQGHVIGNHTTDHLELAELGVDEVRRQIADTDEAVRSATGSSSRFFRAPYGRFPGGLAGTLNDDGALAHYQGSVHWNVDCDDWQLWRDRVDAEVCAQLYLEAIERAAQGIVLMHDCTADVEEWQAGNATYETIRLLLPELRRRGYTFIGLDEVDSLQG